MTVQETKRKVSDFLDRTFVSREFYLRSDGRVHFIRLTALHQKLAAAAAVFAVTWMLFSSTAFVVHQFVVADKESEIERHKLAYFDLLTEVGEYHDQFATITQNLEDNQSFLLSLLQQDQDGRGDLEAIEGLLKTSETEHERVVVARDGLKGKLEQFENDLLEIAERNVSLQSQVTAMRDALTSTRAERSQVAEARAQLGRKLEEVERRLVAASEVNQQLEITVGDLRGALSQGAEERTALLEVQNELKDEIAVLEGQIAQSDERETAVREQLAAVEHRLARVSETGRQVRDQRDTLESQVAGMQERMSTVHEVQMSLIERLRTQTDVSVESLEKTVAMTGIDVDAVLRRMQSDASAQGGPFVSDDLVGEGPHIEASLSSLDLRLDRWTALQTLLKHLPLSVPLEQYNIASSFGVRRDPINGRKARHQGMDFGAVMRSSIFATAPGKVVFAGWRGHYGRMVEIDHGYGIRTRYGHMRRILVEVGDVLTNRQKIGLVGSSGRSTGPHVHYEVRIDGKPLNPAKFLTAGKHVFKG